MSTINEKLNELYSTKWTTLVKELNKIKSDDKFPVKPTNPLLLNIEDEEDYNSSEIRLMIFGQETNSWFGEFDENINEVTNLYKDYFLSGDWELDSTRAFWQGIKNLHKPA